MIHLPYRFLSTEDGFLITNETGQYYFLESTLFSVFLHAPSQLPSSVKSDLISKFFLSEEQDMQYALEETAIKLRTKKAFLRQFTTLHIIVLTYACNAQCAYCHATSELLATETNMTVQTARKVCECIIQSPSPEIKVEFQGGEPTLNFEVLRFIVEYLTLLNRYAKKRIEYVVCTNCISLSQEHLAFYKRHDVFVSTSVDGPPEIHDVNRFCSLPNSKSVFHNIQILQEQYGHEKVSALLTVTKKTLPAMKACVDQYVALGLHSIFFRSLNPYGRATHHLEDMGYETQEFLTAYEDVLDYIIDLNAQGTFLREELACLFLRKILTPFSNGFVDIQSPPGAGIGGVVYDCDGGVYPTDEARMLARCGDATFLLGNVTQHTYNDIFSSVKLREIVKTHVVECEPHCIGCPFIPYCGLDPVRMYQERRLGRLWSACEKYQGIFRIVFDRLQNNVVSEAVFWSWLSGRSYEEVIL